MSRLMTRIVRLVKIGAVAGTLVGLGRLIMQRRRRSQADESSWPTIAETAAQNGQPVDDQSSDADKDPAQAPADDGDGSSADDAGNGDGASDDEADKD